MSSRRSYYQHIGSTPVPERPNSEARRDGADMRAAILALVASIARAAQIALKVAVVRDGVRGRTSRRRAPVLRAVAGTVDHPGRREAITAFFDWSDYFPGPPDGA